MPKDKQKHDDRLRFLADRMALLMCELTNRDLDFGPFCFEEWYTDKRADQVRDTRTYEINIDFVRRMLRRHDGIDPDAANAAQPARTRLPGGGS